VLQRRVVALHLFFAWHKELDPSTAFSRSEAYALSSSQAQVVDAGPAQNQQAQATTLKINKKEGHSMSLTADGDLLLFGGCDDATGSVCF